MFIGPSLIGTYIASSELNNSILEEVMLTKLNAHKNQKGFTLIELLIVIAIIGILAAVAIPQFAQYRNRANAAQVQSDLHNVYLSCKAFWGTGDNTPLSTCDMVTISEIGGLYGFVATNNVTSLITTGTEVGFVATATHLALTGVTFDVNDSGEIGNTAGY